MRFAGFGRYSIDGGQVELGLIPITAEQAILPPGISVPIGVGSPIIDITPPTFSASDFSHTYRLEHGTLLTPGDSRVVLTGNQLAVPNDLTVLGFRLRGTCNIIGTPGLGVFYQPFFTDGIETIVAPIGIVTLPQSGQLKVEWVADFTRGVSESIFFGSNTLPIQTVSGAQIEVLGILVQGRFS